ncbi:unnamed protein product [Protopolystoma xenopodis]|uniref:Uncharacterized protein n=1 Tax=Protopolystoma xenopodis TaxID=117903 RepID=A0A448WEU8_9PLAT|nr:unnamed protein product [Protopolystoma xenopodis]
MPSESSTRSHRGRRTVSRCLLCTIQQTKVQDNPPSVSDESNLRIPSTRLLKRNDRLEISNIESSKTCRLFMVRGERLTEGHLLELPALLSSLRTRGSFCLVVYSAVPLNDPESSDLTSSSVSPCDPGAKSGCGDSFAGGNVKLDYAEPSPSGSCSDCIQPIKRVWLWHGRLSPLVSQNVGRFILNQLTAW